MKVILVKNLAIQFDTNSTDNPLEVAQEMLDAINGVMTQHFSYASPQILIGGLDSSDIDVNEFNSEDNDD